MIAQVVPQHPGLRQPCRLRQRGHLLDVGSQQLEAGRQAGLVGLVRQRPQRVSQVGKHGGRRLRRCLERPGVFTQQRMHRGTVLRRLQVQQPQAGQQAQRLIAGVLIRAFFMMPPHKTLQAMPEPLFRAARLQRPLQQVVGDRRVGRAVPRRPEDPLRRRVGHRLPAQGEGRPQVQVVGRGAAQVRAPGPHRSVRQRVVQLRPVRVDPLARVAGQVPPGQRQGQRQVPQPRREGVQRRRVRLGQVGPEERAALRRREEVQPQRVQA